MSHVLFVLDRSNFRNVALGKRLPLPGRADTRLDGLQGSAKGEAKQNTVERNLPEAAISVLQKKRKFGEVKNRYELKDSC